MAKFRKLFVDTYSPKQGFVIESGDPPHAIQLVIKEFLEHKLITPTVSQAGLVLNKIKNTRLKQFLKV
jgi:hypothetical protein